MIAFDILENAEYKSTGEQKRNFNIEFGNVLRFSDDYESKKKKNK